MKSLRDQGYRPRTRLGGHLPNPPFFGMLLGVALWVLSVASPVLADSTRWQVVPGESRISFSGEHAGNKFKGTFGTWDAVIAFDPADLAGSKATVTIALASAKTGDITYDKTMPTADWFDVAHGPTAVFETTAFRAKGSDAYEADATLSMRGLKVPVVFAFTFKADGDHASLAGSAKLKRLDFGIGRGSDGDGSWVSLDIPVEVGVLMTRAP